MPRRASLANALTKGVLDPALSERIDLEHYYNGLESALNVECFPQGGVRRRAGTTKIAKLRHRLQPINVIASMIAAPNGGTIANLLDQNAATRFTTNAVSAHPFVLMTVDLGGATTVAAVDVLGYACAIGRFLRSLAVEYWNGAAWVLFAPDQERAVKMISSGVFSDTLRQDDVSSKGVDARVAKFDAPFDGKITKLKVTLDAALATADATVTLRIGGVPVTGGVATIPVSGSTAGTTVEVTPTGANTVTADQEITATVGGGSTATATLDIAVTIEEVQQVRSRRFALAPGSGATAQLWRVVVYNAVGAGAISVSGVRFWQEKRQLSPVMGFSFARASDLLYELILTDRNIDVFRNGAWQAAVPVDIDAQQVPEIEPTQSLDTALLYHEDIQTPRIMRQGANDEWDGQPVKFYNVPALTPGTAFAGDQNEVQEVRLAGIVNGDRLVLWLGGSVTAPITYNASTFPADAAAALIAIGVPSGLSGAALSDEAGVRLVFTGTAGARRWPLVTACMLGIDDIDPVTTIVQRGLDAQGPLMGETTGWPRCGVMYQERHICAGFRGAPLTYGVSRFADNFDFDDDGDPLTADLGFFGTLNSDQLETIHKIAVARHILFFTESGEWFAEARTIDATQPFHVNLSTRTGIRPNVPLAFVDGSVLFMQEGGGVLRDLLYSDVEASYTADPLNLLAPHLVKDVVDLGFRQQRSTDEGNQIILVNRDGTIAFMALLKSQKVVAFAPWDTDGSFRRAFGDVQRRMWLIVERETAPGGPELYLEQLDGTHTLDAAFKYDNGGAPIQVLTGQHHLDDKQVWAWTDGNLVGPLLCDSATVRLPAPASEVVIGLFPRLRGRLPKLREKLQTGYPWRPPARVYEMELALAGTGQLDIAVNGGPFREVPLTKEQGLALEIGSDPPRDTSGISEASQSEKLERLIRSIVMIPGSGEFVYGTTIVQKNLTGGGFLYENMHNTTGDPDFKVSLGQLRRALPTLDRISLFVSWYGSDLRCGQCTIKPKVDQLASAGTWTPYGWSVSGLARGNAERVSLDGTGRPLYGGTPSDRSVIEGIREIKAQGHEVILTPFLLMDITAGMALPSPYGGLQQPLPWRGRITCNPAPGQVGTPDLTGAAAAQVATFVGTAVPGHFTHVGDEIFYSGPAEWSYRRFILHHAALARAAGGVDTFVIGSEMRHLTWVRSALGVYPFVTALAALAADVKAMLGPSTKVTYAADWSEVVAHQTGVPGELFFHLDDLWANPAIDAIGIDNYWPLSDWRGGSEHADYVSGWKSVFDRAYLQSNIAGGEGFDWYYQSQAHRDAQTRTPITDGLGKPWVWRYKDIKSWWLNQHFNRPAGTQSGTPTPWVPQSKPIWFMEVGCPAVDRGANQPNVFYDPRSIESFFPYYSRSFRDDKMQRAYLEALISFYTPGMTGFSEANNPVSSVTGKRMVEAERIFVYCWDARFYPAFPQLGDIWGDGALWERGHWLTGRLQLTTGINSDALPIGTAAALALRDRLITGNVRLTNLRGFSRHPTIEFSQSKPAPFELRAIRYEVVHG